MELIEPTSVPRRDFSIFSVRDGRLAPVTCVTCGCRLERHDDGSWWHFAGRGNRDARGCIVECAERPHYAPGGMAAVSG
jgi:hypothetical protein